MFGDRVSGSTVGRQPARARPHPRADAARGVRPARPAPPSHGAGACGASRDRTPRAARDVAPDVAREEPAGYHTAAPADPSGQAGGDPGGQAGDAARPGIGDAPRARHSAQALARCVTTPGSPLGQALGALADAVDTLAGVDVHSEHPDVCGDALVAAMGLAGRLHAGVLDLLDSFDSREGWAADGAVSASSWLAARTGTDHTAAHALVHTARRLRTLRRVHTHLAAGDIAPAHAAAITRAAVPHRAAAIRHAEDILADLACTNPPRDLRHALRALADAADPDGTDPPNDQPHPDPLRALRLRAGYGGRGELDATLDPLTREALTVLLDAFDTPDPKDTPHDQRRTPTQRRHDAFAAMLHTLLAQPGLPTVQGARPHILITIDLAALLGLPPDHPAADTTLADLAGMLNIDLADLGLTPPPTDETDPAADPADTTAPADPAADTTDPADGETTADTTDHADTTDPADGADPVVDPADPQPADSPDPPPEPPDTPPPPRPPRFGSRIPLTPAAVRGLLPAATVMAVLTLGAWRPVNVGKAHRTLPAWLRTVLIAMHQHCRGPDCDNPASWTHAHHIIAWATSHTTDLNQTLPLCPAHHKLLDQGWTATLNHTTGVVTWTSPTGRIITVPPPRT